MSFHCPCGSNQTYHVCCELFINGKAVPTLPEQLMRSRYTAYSQANIPYIMATMRAQALANANPQQLQTWAERVVWLGLEVLEAAKPKSKEGFVTFQARFREPESDQIQQIYERSRFLKKQGRWFYVDGSDGESLSYGHY